MGSEKRHTGKRQGSAREAPVVLAPWHLTLNNRNFKTISTTSTKFSDILRLKITEIQDGGSKRADQK